MLIYWEGIMAVATPLANHLLVAMPSMLDPNFSHTVIYVCEHHEQGTVGLIINRPLEFPLKLVFEQMHIESLATDRQFEPVLFGGPIQPERGFVIHRPLGVWRSSLVLADEVTITTSNDIIRAIAQNTGPKDALITLGYVGWSHHQLDNEIMNNAWLVCPFKPEILYDVPFKERWMYAGQLLGVNMLQLSSDSGHA
jgi:putative transcriptional regulator